MLAVLLLVYFFPDTVERLFEWAADSVIRLLCRIPAIDRWRTQAALANLVRQLKSGEMVMHSMVQDPNTGEWVKDKRICFTEEQEREEEAKLEKERQGDSHGGAD